MKKLSLVLLIFVALAACQSDDDVRATPPIAPAAPAVEAAVPAADATAPTAPRDTPTAVPDTATPIATDQPTATPTNTPIPEVPVTSIDRKSVV